MGEGIQYSMSSSTSNSYNRVVHSTVQYAFMGYSTILSVEGQSCTALGAAHFRIAQGQAVSA